jgi:hypothetical protein
MSESSKNRVCIPGCKLPVPIELDSVGLCVYHFTWSVEGACAEMHRQVALRLACPHHRVEMASYIAESGLLLARVTANLCLSDTLKRRVLCTFLSLMNLRDNLERVPGSFAPDLKTPLPALSAAPSQVPDWVSSKSNAILRSQV